MGKRKKKNKNQGIGNEGPMKRIMLSIPVPDDRPNWPDYERHEVMMSVTMEYAPPTLLDEYLAVICPVAKRRIAVSYLGWTCSYNKLLNMDRKFQSALPGGNVRSIQVVKSNDMCVLDCLHLKAERTFYILDLMHWKQLPYYQAEAEFRFHWIRQVENEMDLRTCHPENEYMFKSLPRFACREDILYEALEDAPFKVDGILFFHKSGFYTPGTTVNVLWLPPEDIEKVLGWKPPDKIMQGRKKPTDTPKPAATKGSGDAASAKASAATTITSETATGDGASAKASAATANPSETATGDAASAKASAATANTSETATGDAASAKASASTTITSETATGDAASAKASAATANPSETATGDAASAKASAATTITSETATGDAASAKASAATTITSETATGDAASAKASAATTITSETATGDAASAKASAATANPSETAAGDAASAKASAATAKTSETATTASAENSATAVSSSS